MEVVAADAVFAATPRGAAGCAQGQSLVVFNAGFDVTRDSCCNCVSVSNTGLDVSRDSCFDCKSVRLQTSELCMQVIGKQAFTPDALPTSGSMRGISTRLLLAVCGNGDSNIQLGCTSSSSYVPDPYPQMQ